MSDVSRFVVTQYAGDKHVLVNRQELVDEDFSGLRSRNWRVVDSRLERCRFDGVKGTFVFGSGRQTSEYVQCSFDRAQLTGWNPGRARFVRCSFRDVDMRKMLFREAEFIDCVFTGRLREVSFTGAITEGQADVGRSLNRYERNDFSGATLAWVAFKGGIDLLDQRLPAEDGYLLVDDAERVLPAALADVLTWPDSAEKKAILVRLEMEFEDVIAGQRQVLFSPYDWVSRDGSRERAFARLSELLIRLGARNPGTIS